MIDAMFHNENYPFYPSINQLYKLNIEIFLSQSLTIAGIAKTAFYYDPAL